MSNFSKFDRNQIKNFELINKKNITLSLLISSLLGPSLYYFYTIRNSEEKQKESYWILFLSFLWGMFPSVILTQILYFVIDQTIFKRYLNNLSKNTKLLISASIMAPVIEEFSKGIGLIFFKKYLHEEEDYLIYSSISGLGFATIENFLYGSIYGKDNIESTIIVVIRQLTATILHMFASSKFGEGMKFIIDKSNRNFYSFLKLYFESILYHAAHNFSAFIAKNYILNLLILIILIILYNVVVIKKLRDNIKELDQKKKIIKKKFYNIKISSKIISNKIISKKKINNIKNYLKKFLLN